MTTSGHTTEPKHIAATRTAQYIRPVLCTSCQGLWGRSRPARSVRVQAVLLVGRDGLSDGNTQNESLAIPSGVLVGVAPGL